MYVYICTYMCTCLLLCLVFCKQSLVIWSALHFYSFFLPGNYAALISPCTGDRSAQISGKSSNQRLCSFGMQIPFAFFKFSFSFFFLFCSQQQTEQSNLFPSGTFCVITKAGVSQTAAKKLWASLLRYSVRQNGLLPELLPLRTWPACSCKRIDRAKGKLELYSRARPCLCSLRSLQTGSLRFFWQKKLQLLTFGINASKVIRPCPDQEVWGESEAAIWFSLVA